MMKEAINHKGFALLDILQPCVTYNQRQYLPVVREDGSTVSTRPTIPRDRAGAFAKALEFGDRIPLGVIYRNDRPPFNARPALADVAAEPRNPSTRPASKG